MGIITKLESSGRKKRPARNYGGFAAAEFSRLTASLAAQTTFINNTLRYDLRALRARSRQAAMNNPFMKRFLNMVVDNVAGPAPFRLESKVKFNTGRLDEGTNEKVESAWRKWGRLGECEITGKHSWVGLQRLIVRILAMDGEVLLRKVRGRKTKYGFGYQLQLIDVDRLWERHNASLSDGGAISMGIEIDAYGKPVAYHILKRKPAQWMLNSGVALESERVLADEIIHFHLTDFAEQVRGIPWIYAALLNLVNLGAFEEAAIIAGRVGASQMGIITAPDGGEQLGGDDPDAEKKQQKNPEIEAEPGMFPVLPAGYKVESWNPKYPDAAVEPFIKAMLRGVSAGLGVAYHNLANDLEGVNYSSAKIGEEDERDNWIGIQEFLKEHFHQPTYEDWLLYQLMNGKLPLDPMRIDRYRDVLWQGRRWSPLDPSKEVPANISAVNAGMTSLTRLAAERGYDVEDIFEEIANEQALAKEKGIKLNMSSATPAPQNQPGQPPADSTGAEDNVETEDTSQT